MKRRYLLGLPVDAVTHAEAVELAAEAIRERRRLRILVMNANKAWLAHRDPRLHRHLEEAELVIPEWACVWASRVIGVPGLHHIGGITLMKDLLDAAPARRWTVYLLGATEEVVSALAAKLNRERPGLRICGFQHGYLNGTQERRTHAELAELRPDLLFVAMGSPLQEYWIASLPDGPRVSLGVGGSFDVLAGFKKDAPAWARGRGLEWLYRLGQDPRRLWRRYLVTNTWFVWSVLRERARVVFSQGQNTPDAIG